MASSASVSLNRSSTVSMPGEASDRWLSRVGECSAVHNDKNRHSHRCLSRMGPQLSNNFRGSIQTPSTCSPRLLTIVSSGRRVPLLGCWLGFARGRTCTSEIVSTDFIAAANLLFTTPIRYLPFALRLIVRTPKGAAKAETPKKKIIPNGKMIAFASNSVPTLRIG